MRFAQLGERGSEKPVVELDDVIYDLSGLTAAIDGRFLEGDGVEHAMAAIAADDLPVLTDTAGLRFGAPIARPSAVICIGQNYAAHAAESGSTPPTSPVVFLKPPNTVVGPNELATIPRRSVKTDWEVELGVVIKQRVSYLGSPDESIDYIAGFVTANDLSERDFQREPGLQWSKGKSAPGFCPVGPWLVTPDQVDYNNVRLRSWVNGEPRQDSTSADMIFSVNYLVWHLSQYLTLEPGDLILTGTPQGVAMSGRFPFLAAGDVLEVEVDGLGRQRQDVVQAEEPAA
ncbi:MAG: 2,4-didehydro-3-deoxy-L-rhamnonate hydrolase [Microbacteriaceae bacterium]|nr:2,4-didehydro-3-deoxy-L-rhamnonate hydrolase [Microbacteriaceae bacterium]